MAGFWKGKNSTLKFVLTGVSIREFLVMSWSCKRNGVEIADGICGQDRDDLDFETNYFEQQITVQSKTLELMKAFIAEQKLRDTKIQMKDSALGIIIKPNDGTKVAFQARGVVLGAWDLNVGGRVDRNKMTVPLRSAYWEDVPTF